MKIEEISIEQIKPYERNNRTHPQQQIDRIAESIKQFGFNQPVVIDEQNIVLVGHGRLLAAQKLGLQKIPVVIKKDLSEKQKRAYRILDNKLQNDSAWEFENLEQELLALESEGFELEPWGLEELKNLFGVETSNDPEQEWQDMPAYESEDETALQTIKVHFLSREHVEDFAKLMNQKITNATKSIWHPKNVSMNLKQIRVVDNDE